MRACAGVLLACVVCLVLEIHIEASPESRKHTEQAFYAAYNLDHGEAIAALEDGHDSPLGQNGKSEGRLDSEIHHGLRARKIIIARYIHDPERGFLGPDASR